MDVTSIIEIISALIVAIITYTVIPYIKSRTTATQQEQINALVKIAVQAAEQLIIGTGLGKERKAYVLSWLAANDITVDMTKIDALIESAVYELKQQKL
jgi:hypothetical protein